MENNKDIYTDILELLIIYKETPQLLVNFFKKHNAFTDTFLNFLKKDEENFIDIAENDKSKKNEMDNIFKNIIFHDDSVMIENDDISFFNKNQYDGLKGIKKKVIEEIIDIPICFEDLKELDDYHKFCDDVFNKAYTKKDKKGLSIILNNKLDEFLQKENYIGADKIWHYMKKNDINKN